ncbi:MAG: hypothetical protein WAV02_24785 [Stellaceae bacterium]
MFMLPGLANKGRATRNFLLILCAMHVILFVDRVNLAAAAETIKGDLLPRSCQRPAPPSTSRHMRRRPRTASSNDQSPCSSTGPCG